MTEFIRPNGHGTETPKPKASFRAWYSEQMALPADSPLRNLAKRADDFLTHFADYVIYDDPDLLVINKLAGFPTDGIYCTVTQLAQEATGNPNIFPVHRLDKDTSGVLVLGNNGPTRASMQRQFTAHEVNKMYAALVQGEGPDKIAGIVAPMAPPIQPETSEEPVTNRRHMEVVRAEDAETRNAKYSASAFCKLAGLRDSQGFPWSLVAVRILTGRTHQIRVHASHLGFPIMGDREYNSDFSGAPRQMLHAYKMSFRRPRTDPRHNDRLTFKAPLPPDFKNILSSMHVEKVNRELYYEIIQT